MDKKYISRQLFLSVIFIIFIIPTDSEKVEPLSLPYGSYYCYLRCLAKCLETETLLNPCSVKCAAYKNSSGQICEEKDTKCWNACNNLTDGRSSVQLQNPVILYVNYSIVPAPNPRQAIIEWTPVPGAKLYFLQYVEVDDKFNSWDTGGLGHMESISLRATVTKKNLCPVYGFRVAAVNKDGISVFSDVETLQKPIPFVPNPIAVVEERELLDIEYIDITGRSLGNGTVRATVRYNTPPGWSLKNKEYRAQFSYPHLLTCEKCNGETPSFPLPSVQLDPNDEPLAYFDFPSFVYQCDCLFTAPLDSLKSKCGTVFNYENRAIDIGPSPMLNFTCENTKNTKCTQVQRYLSPMCTVDDFGYASKVTNHSEFKNVTIHWNPIRSAPKGIEYYLIRFIRTEKVSTQAGPVFDYKAIEELGDRRIYEHPVMLNGTVSMTVDDLFHAGQFYVVHICAIYNESTEKNIKFKISGRFYLDFTDETPDKIIPQHSDDSSSLTIGLAVGLSLLFAILAVALTTYIILSRRYCVKPKSINELGLEEKREHDDRYVAMPRRFDAWELSRKRLQIYEDQKLGSGAFGAVYKGKILGNLITHKNSMSVLAENWMKTEDCEVAVKMLPEYADETSKSDFRKEINLMKQLGFHERLVNMLACISAEDPLCLIVEFCSEGDLLHYLRERRKYMIKLEQNNVDINSSEVSDLDYNMILCLKDLISFAWQISVGMEYLCQKGFIHRDVAARNILVDKGKKAKIGDFGLCRFSSSDPIYMGKGGRLPIKWMALEAIKNYEFTIKSDVWSFGVLLFEIVTLGGSPYPGVQPSDMEQLLEAGQRMDQPDNCPNELYEMMISSWRAEQDKRPSFTMLRDQLRIMLEQITVDYSYLSLNQKAAYYNVVYGEDHVKQNDLITGISNKNAFKNFNFTPDHEIEMNSDNMISDNVFHSNIPDGTAETQKYQPSMVPVTNLLHNAVHTDSISLTGDSQLSPTSPSSGVLVWRDSTSSDKALITPVNNDNGKNKIFSFFKPSHLEDLPEASSVENV